MRIAGVLKNLLRVTVAFSVSCGSLNAQGLGARNENFPSKPVRWIVPFPPGGSADIIARIVGQRLSERIGQPVIVDNRAGGSGTIGMEAAARAAPDGYTIFLGSSNEAINPILRKLAADPLKDLTAVVQLGAITFVLLANTKFPAPTVPELLLAARSKPGTTTCGWGAPVFQIACEMLRINGHADINVIPYKGAALAMNDLIGGQIDLTFNSTLPSLPHVNDGRARAIATTNARRGIGPFGHLPTIGEALPGFELSGWFGVLAPSATPPQIVVRLNREVTAVLREDEVRKRLTDGGLEVAHGSPEEFAEIIRRDHARFSKVIREAGIKPE